MLVLNPTVDVRTTRLETGRCNGAVILAGRHRGDRGTRGTGGKSRYDLGCRVSAVMPDGLVTSRSLQNGATGIDLRVPLHQEVRGAMMTGHVEYQIIVITRLVAFKSPRHKPGDVVQLVVSKKYSEMDELYFKLIARYPKFPLPAMPRKALFVGEADIRERRVAFDDLMKAIAKHPTLATCPEMMEFLGAKSVDVDVKTRNVLLGEEPVEVEDNDIFFQSDEASAPSTRRPAAQPRKSSHIEENENKTKGDDEEEEEEEEESEEQYLGPLGNTKSITKKAKPPPKPKPMKAPLFGDDESMDTDFFHFPNKEGHLKSFEDPDLGVDSLLLPTSYAQQAESSAGLFLDEDTDSLFRIEDDFDKLLQVTKRTKDKPFPAPKPNLKPKPTWSEKPSAGAGPLASGQLKDQMDILKYIQQNESDGTKEEDLF
ncbi:HCLS1-binding protein 3 [Merluccius polli]|uniref:HCLS1-binding protein 3 n=1 Tax=Merluccius polli TaxID=89951 RepID=A0AA47N633_MERPO|nr:HCLS1-binding protein 3 [Merluccius polli]